MAPIPTAVFTAATRVSFGLDELAVQANTKPLVRFENGNTFHVQTDGNLCYYDTTKCTWHSASNVGSGDPSKLNFRFQDDGNMVLYYEGKPVWDTKTTKTGKKLVVSDQTPYLMILDQYGNIAWNSQQEKK